MSALKARSMYLAATCNRLTIDRRRLTVLADDEQRFEDVGGRCASHSCRPTRVLLMLYMSCTSIMSVTDSYALRR